MHSQIQCPVCTLYLHVGMNLHVHLDTHPKDQVIRALVNMTVVQSHVEDEPINQMKCSRYAPLSDDSAVTTANTVPNTPLVEPTLAAAPVAAAVKPVELHCPILTVVPEPNIPLSVPPAEPARQPQINQLQSSSLPPPPPYGEYKKLCAIVRSDSNTTGISTYARNHILQEATNNPTVTPSEIQSQAEEETSYMRNGEEDYVTEDDYQDTDMAVDDDQQYNTDDVVYVGEEDQLQDHDYNYDEMPVEMDDTETIQENAKPEAIIHDFDRLRSTQSPQPTKSRRILNRRRSNGLQVLSDVTLTSDLAITSIINVQKLNQINLTDLFHGSMSTKQKTEETEEICLIDLTGNDPTYNGPKSSTELSDDKTSSNPDIQLVEAEVADSADNPPTPSVNQESTQTERNIIIVNAMSLSASACSTNHVTTPPCAATSVIRMASSPHKLTSQIAEQPEPQPSSSRTTAKLLLAKHPFVKQPKKLVVKFKKPFVPVIEEEANLQPPDRPIEISDPITINNFRPESPAEQAVEETAIDSHPFSPFRQSFTPVPIVSNEPEIDPVSPATDQLTGDPDICEANEMKTEQIETVKTAPQNSDYIDDVPEEDSKDFQIVDTNKGDPVDLKVSIEFENDCMPDIYSAGSASTSTSTTSSYASVAATSSCASTSNSYDPRPGPSSRHDYGLSLFLGYNAPLPPVHPPDHQSDAATDEFYGSAAVRPSSVEFPAVPSSDTADYGWSHRFSPQYVPFETDKSSYTNLDDCKTISRTSTSSTFDGADRTAATSSSDSVNIRTDEQMPAKGEISEQESNGDVDGSWSQQVNINFALRIGSP